MKPRVLNLRARSKLRPLPGEEFVFVGRPSPWGNPFHTHCAGRAKAIALYEERLLSDAAMVERAKRELRGKSLACYCAPMRCHADVLLRVANEDT